MKVNICGIDYTVQYKEDSYQSDGVHLGEINYIAETITINPDLGKGQRTQTIWHEIIHGVLHHLGYTELCNDEQFVTALSGAIANVKFTDETPKAKTVKAPVKK